MSQPTVILASTSAARQKMLRDAAVAFTPQAASVDEVGLQHTLANLAPKAQAMEFASAKALSLQAVDAIIIGADQTLEFAGRAQHKARSVPEAKSQLAAMSGQTHHLHSAVACAINHKVAFEHISTATLKMRNLSDAFIDHYVAAIGDRLLHTVGGYEFEGLGAQLFEKVEGDYHTILGLPLLPLLAFLRQRGVIPT